MLEPLGAGWAWIPSRGWSPARSFAVLFVVTGGAFEATIAVLAIVGDGTIDPAWAIPMGLIAGVWTVMAAMFLTLTTVRSVGLAAEGVRVQGWLSSRTYQWENVAPDFHRSLPLGGLRVSFRAPDGAFSTVVMLSVEQGRALVNYPSAPKWVVPSGVRDRWIAST